MLPLKKLDSAEKSFLIANKYYFVLILQPSHHESIFIYVGSQVIGFVGKQIDRVVEATLGPLEAA